MLDHQPPPGIEIQAIRTIDAMSERGFTNPQLLPRTARSIASVALAKVDIVDKVTIRMLTNRLVSHAIEKAYADG